jgi:hypothetical protein
VHLSGKIMDIDTADITLSELEQAINYWRGLRPSRGEERALSPEVNQLAEVYALMIYERLRSVPRERVNGGALSLIDGWRGQRV